MSLGHSEGISLRKTSAVCLVILASVAITVALIYTKAVMVPLTIAIFISSIICALVDKTSKYTKAPPWLKVLKGILLAILVFAIFSWIFYYTFLALTEHIETYKDSFEKLWKDILVTMNRMGINLEMVTWEIENINVVKYAQSITGSLFSILGNFVLVIAFSLFLITGGLLKRTKTPKLFSEINEKISRYAAVKLSMSLFTGIIVGIILSLFKIELALVLGFLTVVLNFIPAIGSILATIIPIPILILQLGINDYRIILITAIVGLVQLCIGNLLEPKFYGESLDLHPITVLAFLIFWGLVWGAPGMFLAVPITGVLKIILSRIPVTKSLSEAFSGRFI